MSYEDLKNHNIFLPENVWGESDLHTTVNQPLVLGILIFGLATGAFMVFGRGYTLTWVGMVLFWVFMFLFTVVSNMGIESQNEEIDRLIEEHD
jgi:hypothetical protein